MQGKGVCLDLLVIFTEQNFVKQHPLEHWKTLFCKIEYNLFSLLICMLNELNGMQTGLKC